MAKKLRYEIHKDPGVRMGKRPRASNLFATTMAVLLLLNGGGVIAQTQQQHVHDMSHGVMPFDVAKTVHISG
jgi:hypothetical protein